MLLIIHIVIALGSVLFTGFVSFFPTLKRLYVVYASVAATLLTGTILIINKPSHMVSACVMGLVYIGAVIVGIVLARAKLAANKDSEL